MKDVIARPRGVEPIRGGQMKRKWYVGKYRGGGLYETCWGLVRTGYWYAGGPENKPYTHSFWGLVWGTGYTFGVGYIQPEEPIDWPDVGFIDENPDTGG